MMRVPLLLIALVDVAAACAPEESDFRGQAEGAPIPADGSCRAGVVVPRGERCTHEYSYRVGTRITSSGSQSVVEVGAVVFRVDADGVGHYGDALFGTHIERTIEFDGEAIRFVARARDDGSLDIEESDRRGRARRFSGCARLRGGDDPRPGRTLPPARRGRRVPGRA
ncbi:MAG: hypothetical protein F4Z77_08990 [Dehalococcoidia bacterium]|nr:hypothetical protein [Dehalococcoidia bacterium]MYA53263.1 hypothetical protein [Dehalococcoidia bacterium]